MRMSQFTDPIQIRQDTTDPRYWITTAVHRYHVGSEDSAEVITVPEGRRTDLQSIPRFSWSIVGHPLDAYAASGLFHDEIYRYPENGVLPDENGKVKPRGRRRCDQIYLEMNIVLKCPWWKRTLKYSAVRIGGGGAWKRYRAAQVLEQEAEQARERARAIVAKIHEKYKGEA